MMNSSKKVGGGAFDMQRATTFNRRVNACGLIDLGYNGNKYTWSGKQHGGIIVRERIDRALANDSWMLKFPEAKVFLHLPKILSDHHPIMVNVSTTQQIGHTKLFRFDFNTCGPCLIIFSITPRTRGNPSLISYQSSPRF